MMHADAIESRSLRPLRREEYDRLVELGFFQDERLELLKGRLVLMSPQNAPHATAVRKLNKLLVRLCGDVADVRPQSPILAGEDSEPEPDFAVVEPSESTNHPETALLVVEVADSSLTRDRDVKGPIYAEAGYPEYWIVNLPERCVEIYRDPVNGRYRTASTALPGQTVRCVALPRIELEVDQILP